LLATAHDFDEKNIPILVLKPSADTRDGKNIIKSRAGLERECISIGPEINIFDVVNEFNDLRESENKKVIKWILVDECQFLTEEQVDQLSDVADFLDVEVMCFGLRTDFQSNLFEGSRRLFEIADDIEEIKASCECGEKKTSINARFDENGEIITEGSQVEIGGNEKYKAICRKCWKDKVRDKLDKKNEK
jgi:thymidine kinase